MSETIIERIKSEIEYISDRESGDYVAFNCPAEKLLEFSEQLKSKYGFDMLVDVSGVDWGVDADIRFSSVFHVLSTRTYQYLRVVGDCLDNENPEIPSVSSVWPAANWHERETYDMFGITYTNHPDLRRILMWDEYPYHPLRKDFPLAGKDCEFPAADVEEVTSAKVESAPMMGGPFVSSCHSGHMSSDEPRAKDQSWTESNEKPNSGE